MQAIFHFQSIRDLIEINPWDILSINLHAYINTNEPFDMFNIIRRNVSDISADFSVSRQQCVADFLTSINQYSKILDDSIAFKMTNKITCGNNDCGLFRIEETNESILYLSVLDTNPSALQSIIDSYFTYKEPSKEAICCDGCLFKGKTKTTNAEFDKTIIVLQLQIFQEVFNENEDFAYDDEGHRKYNKIKHHKLPEIGLKKTKITINENTYKVEAAIFHAGDSVKNGHYFTLPRSDRPSTKVNDDEPITKTQWLQQNAEPYLIFF